MQAIPSSLTNGRLRLALKTGALGLLLLASGLLQGQILGSVEAIEERLSGLREDARDVAIQSGAINEFLQTADEKVAAIEEAIPQLESMSSNLEEINQKNLIKVILQLAFETYSTIDNTTGSAKTAVQSLANHGVTYAAGRLAFDQVGSEAKKAIGLDASSYYSSRNVAIQRITEASHAQSAEIGKVHWALDKDLDYYRALKLEESGSDPGERGAIFFKNQVVRDQIAKAIDALEAMVDVIETERVNAESELEWLEGEAQSIRSMIEAVSIQLEQAKEELKEATITTQTEAVLERVQPPQHVPGFSFRPKQEDEPELTYYKERLKAGVNEIDDILNATIPGLDDFWRDYRLSMETAESEFAAWLDTYRYLIEHRAARDALGPADFGNLNTTLWDRRDAEFDEERLLKAEQELSSIIAELELIEGGFDTFNQAKADLIGIAGIASASAIPVSVIPPAGQAYSFSAYMAKNPGTIIWGGGTFSGLSHPFSFGDFYDKLYEMEEFQRLIDKAFPNTTMAISAYKQHYDGLQSAYASIIRDESLRITTLENATARMAHALSQAERVAAGRPYTFPIDSIHYHGIFKQQFTLQALTDALKEALLSGLSAEPARTLWDDYQAFINSFEAVGRQYRLNVQQALSSHSRIPGSPPSFRSDIEAAHSTADYTGFSAPSISLNELQSIAERYHEARRFVSQAETWPEARNLPDVRVIEDMADAIPADMEAPWINHPIAQALPAFGLLLIKEETDRRFDELMAMDVRDEDAMWDATYGIAHLVDDWKAAQTDGILGGQLFHTADTLKGEQLYERRQTWDREFGVPQITAFSDNVAVPNDGSARLSVSATSKFPVSYAWYRRATFGEDEFIGSGSSVTVPAPGGLESYYCEVSNIHGREFTGWIDVYPAAKPRIAFQPQPVQVPAGQPAQLDASFYLTVPAYVEETAAWYVSESSDPGSAYSRLPGTASNILNLKAVVATRHYFYEVTNPWGTTRTDTVAVRVAVDPSAPVLIPPPDNLMAYNGIAFSYAFTGARLDRFEWQPPADPSGLSFDPDHGVVSGVPTPPPGATIHFKVRAVSDSGNQPGASAWLDVALPVMPASQFPGTHAEQFFGSEQLRDPTVSGPMADPDGDGIPNLLEYAFGGNPRLREASALILPQFTLLHDRGILHFHKPAAPSGFYHVVEYSTDLGNWQPVRGMSSNPLSTPSGMEAVSYQVPFAPPASDLLLRVRVVPVDLP